MIFIIHTIKIIFLCLALFLLPQEALAEELPNNLKTFLKKKYPGIVFKIDNSIVIKNKILLPLIPLTKNTVKEVSIIYKIDDTNDKDVPKLLLFSNNWVFIKLIKQKDNSLSFLKTEEISPNYKNLILQGKLPGDLVVPKDLIIEDTFKSIIGTLPIQVKKLSPINSPSLALKDTDGTLYLTSPDTGKIVYADFKNLSMTQIIQTNGAPLEIAFDKTNKILYAIDFAKDKFYSIQQDKNSILSTIDLESMSSPMHIELSEDGSLIYILQSLSNELAIYKPNDISPMSKTKLPANPVSFVIIKELGQVIITLPNENKVIVLNLTDLSKFGEVVIEGGPEKLALDKTNQKLYITSRYSNIVSIYDLITKKIINTINVGETPTAITLHPDGKTLYVANGKSNTISIVNLSDFQVIETISLPIESQFPGDLKITANGKWLIVTSETTNIIPIIDLISKTVFAKLDVGATTHNICLVEKNSDVNK